MTKSVDLINAVTIGVDPGRITGWCVAVNGKPVAWGQGEAEKAADSILAEILGLDEPVTVVLESAFQGRFGAGVAVAFRAGLILGILRGGLPQWSTVIKCPATQWRRALGWPKYKRKEAKQAAMRLAFELTGDAETKMATREHVAEAICMAVAAQVLEAEQ